MKMLALLAALVSPTVPSSPAPGELRTLGQAVLANLPKQSVLLAVCGPSQGVGYYLTPNEDGWVDDPITMGRMVVVVTPDRSPNIYFKDASGEMINAKSDGAEIEFTFIDSKNESFGLIERYQKTGVTQTYVFSPSPGGRSIMLWTSAKAHSGRASITKAATYFAQCE